MARRPRLIESSSEFDKRVDEYFARCKKDETRPLYTGLIRHLGFVSRQSLYDYSKDERYAKSVAYAKLCMEEVYEGQLGDGGNSGGVIFALKNLGWSDKTELEHTGKDGGNVVVEIVKFGDNKTPS